jgi:hypothetical protein
MPSYNTAWIGKVERILINVLKRLTNVEALAARALQMAQQGGGTTVGGGSSGTQYVQVTSGVSGFNSTTLALGSGSGLLCDDSTGTLVPGSTTVNFDNLCPAFAGSMASPVYVLLQTTSTGRLTCDVIPCT